ncbi:MAG: glycosyltransferase [Pseudomonadota bacterium]
MTAVISSTSQLPLLGFLRFSFFGPSDTRQRHDTEDAFDQLYNDERMNVRFHYYENLFLPSMRAQQNEDFRLVILTSDVMPKHHKERLQDVTNGFKQAEIHFIETKVLHKFTAPLIKEQAENSRSGRVASFRIDDDDALSIQYTQRLCEVAIHLPETAIVTFPKSIALFKQVDGQLGILSRTAFCGSPGLVRINSKNFTRNPFQMMHGIVWKRFLTVSDPSFTSHIQSYHTHNDTIENNAKNLAKAVKGTARYGQAKYLDGISRNLKSNFPMQDIPKLAAHFQADIPKNYDPNYDNDLQA